MGDQGERPTTPGAVVVHESMRLVNFSWGIVVGITLAGVAALNLFVDITLENRTAATVLSVGAPVAFIAWWVWNVTHPGRIEFTPEAITCRVRASKKSMTIERTEGLVEFAIESVVIGTHASTTVVLRSTNGGPALPVGTFDVAAVKRACEETGWTVVGHVPGEPKEKN